MARIRKSSKMTSSLEAPIVMTNLPAVIEGENNSEYAERISQPAPTEAKIAAVLASIDTSMETAVTAGPVDHHSQLSSWAAADS